MRKPAASCCWCAAAGLALNRLPEIRSLANQALQQRPEWFELHALLAEIELTGQQRRRSRLSITIGPKNSAGRRRPRSLQHIRLLAANGRYADAGKLLDRIPEAARQQLLGPLYAEILFRSNQVDAAIKQAKAATEADPKNAQNQYWYGQLLARSSQAPNVTPQRRNRNHGPCHQGNAAGDRAAARVPRRLVRADQLLRDAERRSEAQKTMRDAQLALSGDNLQMFLRAAMKCSIAGSMRKPCIARSMKLARRFGPRPATGRLLPGPDVSASRSPRQR